MKNRSKIKVLTFKDISVGSKYSFSRLITQKDVEDFARLSGDFNPLHLDEKYSKTTRFNGTIIHGMLAASLFSTLIGMHCPGKHALIINQEMNYIRPIRPNSLLKVVGEVTNKVESVKVIIIKTIIYGRGREVMVEGISKVKVMK